MITISAEDVLPGHPDRLCDAVAEQIVSFSCAVDPDALVGVEVALNRHLVLITGRIAAGFVPDVELSDPGLVRHLVRSALESAGYGDRWTHDVDVVTDLHIDSLEDEEREIRRFSVDQCIAVGHADPRGPALMPIEAAAARRLREGLSALRRTYPDALGPDGKVLATVETGPRPRIASVNVAVQHGTGVGYPELTRLLTPMVEEVIAELEPFVDPPAALGADVLRINGAGDFSRGGPLGDNGLSGKKLVVDHYGPRVPIGGGALCGKDPHKPDRVGPLRARQIAVRLAEATGLAATVHLAWMPGREAPDMVVARLADGRELDGDAIEGMIAVPDLRLAASARDLELATVDWVDVVRRGYVGNDRSWDR